MGKSDDAKVDAAKEVADTAVIATGAPEAMHEMEQLHPYPERLSRKAYERELRLLQIELLKMQSWVRDSGERVVIVFEGRDAAGKGGSIRRFTENLNPRGARVAALAKPNEIERTQWYFQRYISHLPAGGELVLFDRSWYNRAGVEIVMGFCTPQEHAEFFRQAPAFEESIVLSGIRLFKLWFTVSQEEQRRRFHDRKSDPLRKWKLSPIDEASLDKYAEYRRARDEMLFYTDRPVSPWTIINSNEKRRSRLESIRHVLSQVPYAHKDASVATEPDPRVVRPATTLSFTPDMHHTT